MDVYRNPLYWAPATCQQVLIPIASVRHIILWKGHYCRWNPSMRPQVGFLVGRFAKCVNMESHYFDSCWLTVLLVYKETVHTSMSETWKQDCVISYFSNTNCSKKCQFSGYSDWLWAVWYRTKSRWGRGFPPIQICPGAHPATCKMGTGSFLGVKCCWPLTPFNVMIMEELSYTSTHPLGHTGSETGSLYLYL